jgi:hypothetical protein
MEANYSIAAIKDMMARLDNAHSTLKVTLDQLSEDQQTRATAQGDQAEFMIISRPRRRPQRDEPGPSRADDDGQADNPVRFHP